MWIIVACALVGCPTDDARLQAGSSFVDSKQGFNYSIWSGQTTFECKWQVWFQIFLACIFAFTIWSKPSCWKGFSWYAGIVEAEIIYLFMWLYRFLYVWWSYLYNYCLNSVNGFCVIYLSCSRYKLLRLLNILYILLRRGQNWVQGRQMKYLHSHICNQLGLWDLLETLAASWILY